MKKISIIIPCYNAAPYIDRCASSLINQTIGIDNLELIFVNDASTDNTLELLLAYEKQYEEHIMVINCEQNGRQGTARNIGLQYASCDYIGFVDADDWVDVTMYEKLYEKATTKNCDMVVCLFDHLSAPDNTAKPVRSQEDCQFLIADDTDRKEFLAYGIPPYVWCRIYKKSMILDNQIFFPEGIFYEDIYWGHMINYYANSIYVIHENLYHYYTNPCSTTTVRNDTKHLDRLVVMEMTLKDYQARGLYDRFTQEISSEFIHIYYLNTFHMMFTRCDVFPLELFEHMRNTVIRYIPNYATLEQYEGFLSILIQLLDLPVTQNLLDDLQKAYLSQFSSS